MKVLWRKSAIQSLLDLDHWRSTNDLTRISSYLKELIDSYFLNKDLTVHIPGRTVYLKNHHVDLRMVLVSVGKSDPYKVFYRLTSRNIEIFLVRHPHQKPLIK